MSPLVRAPVWPSRPRAECASSDILRPAAAASPSRSAVPDGASILARWCISRISISKSSSSDCATRLTIAASRLIPRLILPDLTTMARVVTLLITASSDTERPVVPMTWTRPRWAAIATLAMVAAGTVKSRMPSALADSDHRSADSRTPLAGKPASVPASLPRSSEPGASNAPVRTAPEVSEMARVSARPIRPPAPATIKRMSDMSTSPLPYSRGRLFRQPIRATALRLRPLVTLDDHEVGFGIGAAQRDQAHIFRRIVAGQRGFIILEFQHHVARARGAFHGHMLAAAHQEPGAVFRKYRAVLRDVFLVAVDVVHIDTRDPVAFCHRLFSFVSGQCLRDLGLDGLRRRFGIGGFHHRPSDYQIISPG